MIALRRIALWLAGSGALLAATGCSAPTITAFTITANPANLSVAPGGSVVMTVAAGTTSDKPQTAGLVIYNLPIGVSYTPASPTVTTGGQTLITFTASPGAAASTEKLQVVGYSGLAGCTVFVNLGVTPAS